MEDFSIETGKNLPQDISAENKRLRFEVEYLRDTADVEAGTEIVLLRGKIENLQQENEALRSKLSEMSGKYLVLEDTNKCLRSENKLLKR